MTPETFYLGTPEVSWLRLTDVPLFVSARRLRRQKTWPRARGSWAIDSGGFTELNLHGRWTTTPESYAEELRVWAQAIGNVVWAAPQDWMCEPKVREKTGLDVDEHQARSVEAVLRLRAAVAGAVHVVPVLQGWEPRDYERCAIRYAREGLEVEREPLVGVGTVCRRQGTREGLEVMRAVHGLGVRAHGFGFKRTGLVQGADLLASADSMAWSFNARKDRANKIEGHTHASCANCIEWALRWRAETLRQLAARGVGSAP